MSVPHRGPDVKGPDGELCSDQGPGINRRQVCEQWCSDLAHLIPETGAVGVQAALGTGKTVLIDRLTKGGRAVYIAPLRSLEQSATKQAFGDSGVSRTGIRQGWYDDPERMPGSAGEEYVYHRHLCATEPRVATTYAGLQRGFFDSRDFSRDTVILDEPMQMLAAASLGKIYEKGRREHVERLHRVVGSARRVILLDGHLEPWVVEMLAEHSGIAASQTLFIENTYRPQRGLVHVHESAASMRSEIICLWGQKRILCLFTSRKAVEDLLVHMREVRAWMEENRGEIYCSTGEEPVIPEMPIVITPDTIASDAGVRAVLSDPGATRVPCIIATPVITSGVSFDVLNVEDAAALGRTKGAPRYDHVFVLGMRGGPDGVSMDDIVQMCGRVRGSPTLHVYLSAMEPQVLSIEELRERWMHRAACAGAAVYAATQPGHGLRVAPDYASLVDMAARMEHRRLFDHARGEELLVERLVAAGWIMGQSREATPEEKKRSRDQGKQRRQARLAEVVCAAQIEERGARPNAAQLAAAEIRKAIGYAPDRRFAPSDEALVRIHLARERDGGLPAYLAALAARASDGGFLDALREDAQRQGMSLTGDGIAVPRFERRYSLDGRPRMERVEPLAPQDQVGAVRAFELRLRALQAGGIDVRAALGELTGVVARPDQLDRVHQYLAEHEHEVVRLGVVTAVAASTAAARRKNAQTLLDWWGLQHERLRSGPAKGSWRVSMPPRVRDALYYSGRGAPPPPVQRVEDPMVADVLALFEGWTPYTLLTARDVLADVDRLGLVHLQAALTRPTELGRVKAMGMRLAEWARIGPPAEGWAVVRKPDPTSGRSLYAAERSGSPPGRS